MSIMSDGSTHFACFTSATQKFIVKISGGLLTVGDSLEDFQSKSQGILLMVGVM